MAFRKTEEQMDGFVYRVAGPGGKGTMWIARSATGHVAHGRTPEGAAERLRSGMEALAAASGLSNRRWQRTQR